MEKGSITSFYCAFLYKQMNEGMRSVCLLTVGPITMLYQFQQQTMRADWSNNVRKEK